MHTHQFGALLLGLFLSLLISVCFTLNNFEHFFLSLYIYNYILLSTY
jgi:hypothetical protein